MPVEPIYLDHNSTTPIDPRVIEAMTRAWRDCGANPASQHAAGRKVRRILEDAREGILALLGAKTGGMDADQLLFTSGGTEANNLALLGLIAGTKPGPGRRYRAAISAIEHPSIMAAAAEQRRRGNFVDVLRVDGAGHISLPGDEPDMPSSLPDVLSVMLANNETGVVLSAGRLLQQGREVGAFTHTDAVQAVGKVPVHFRDLGVDALSLAPHKFNGPLGIGALVLRHGIKLQPQLFGGFQQGGLRPGTENAALAVGFHVALKLAISELPERATWMQTLRDQLERLLQTEIDDLVIISKESPRLPNTSCLAFPGLDRQALVMALDLAGVACSTGSACTSGSSEPSPTLVAMGLPAAVVQSAVRFSLGATTTAAEVAEAASRIIKVANHLRSRK
jgi:cysteine desulfurase